MGGLKRRPHQKSDSYLLKQQTQLLKQQFELLQRQDQNTKDLLTKVTHLDILKLKDTTTNKSKN